MDASKTDRPDPGPAYSGLRRSLDRWDRQNPGRRLSSLAYYGAAMAVLEGHLTARQIGEDTRLCRATIESLARADHPTGPDPDPLPRPTTPRASPLP